MRKGRRRSLILGIILLVIGMGLGYAFLTTTLNVDGTTEIDSNTWDVYWDNVQVTDGSVDAEEPVIDSTQTTVTYSIHLQSPGDYYEFTIDTVNDGTIDAMINVISKTINNGTAIPDYLTYEITYEDGLSIEQKQILAAGEFETYKVRVKYRDDISSSQLPGEAVTLTLSFGVDYVQADSTATEVRKVYYYVGNDEVTVGEVLPNQYTVYNNPEDAITALGKPVFIKLTTGADNIIKEAAVGFILNDTEYYAKFGSSNYNENKNILKNAFGEEACQETESGTNLSYYCVIHADETHASVGNNGGVLILYYNHGCNIIAAGTGSCS